MKKTTIKVSGESFLINGKLVYSDIEGSNPEAHGLLMNARFIQGIFDDNADRERYNRWGKGKWDPEANTDALIAALPEWYKYGLRAFTVGFQGGGTVATIPIDEIDNNPFGEDGLTLDPAYAARMDRLIRKADEIGMVVIVSFFYQGQINRLKDGAAIRNAVITASRFLQEAGYSNVIIEVANEQDVGNFRDRPIIYSGEGMAMLIELARQHSGGMLTGCSGGGGTVIPETHRASDVVIIHGNGLDRQRYYNTVLKAREASAGKPVICNEDSPAFSQLEVAFDTKTSWGYYNNLTKQEPPCDWGITAGEDTYFAHRMAMGIGIKVPELSQKKQFHLQGVSANETWKGKKWIRLAALYPEKILRVDFYNGGNFVGSGWAEPFFLNFESNFTSKPVEDKDYLDKWSAKVTLTDGKVIELGA